MFGYMWVMGVVWRGGVRIGKEFGGVKTDLNCCSRISAFERESLFSMPPSRRGDTPMLSFSSFDIAPE